MIVEETIVKMFKEGSSSKEIETVLSINYQKVVKVLLNHGVDYKEEYKKRQEEKYSSALEMYKSGMQFKKICKILNIGPNQLRPYIKSILGEENWRSQKESLKNNYKFSEDKTINNGNKIRKYDLDQTAFDTITEESAYWIGFLYADGSVGKGNGSYRISVSLKESDKEHLEKLCDFFKTPKQRVKHVPSTKSYQLVISSYILWKRLQDLGFNNKKSWNAKPPEELKNNRHFWRGVIDGDGSLNSSLRKDQSTVRRRLDICGTPDTVIDFIIFCEENTDHNFSHIKIGDITNTFSTYKIGQKDKLLAVSRLLYKDSNIYLERKYQKYLEFEEFYKIVNEGE